MRFAVDVPTFGDFADPRVVANLVGPLAEAGATWWAECQWDDLERAEPMARRVDQGPPPLA